MLILKHQALALAAITVGLPLIMTGCHPSRSSATSAETKSTAEAKNSVKSAVMPPPPMIARWQGPDLGSATRPPSPQLSAITRGKLAVFRNCLVLLTGGSTPIVPIFPYGTGEWDSASQTFRHNGKSYHIGDDISLGGGMAPTNPGQYLGKHELPDCGVDAFWISY